MWKEKSGRRPEAWKSKVRRRVLCLDMLIHRNSREEDLACTSQSLGRPEPLGAEPRDERWALLIEGTGLGVSDGKEPPTMQETCVWSLGWEDHLEEGMAAHSSILAWRIPWTEEPGGPQSMGAQSYTAKR